MNINDAINAAIPNIAGIANQINDKLLRFYQANGAVSGDIQDAERQFLIARGVGPVGRTNQDMWEVYLRVTKGYGAKHLNDLKYQYWTVGPRP